VSIKCLFSSVTGVENPFPTTFGLAGQNARKNVVTGSRIFLGDIYGMCAIVTDEE